MSQYSKRTYQRKRIMKILDNQGYHVLGVWGGLFDLVAIGREHIRLIFIRTSNPGSLEDLFTENIKALQVPEFTLKEVWSKKGKKKDLYNVEIL